MTQEQTVQTLLDRKMAAGVSVAIAGEVVNRVCASNKLCAKRKVLLICYFKYTTLNNKKPGLTTRLSHFPEKVTNQNRAIIF